ncbi:MAG: cupin domain-containing protein [Rhodobacteraceae bacterium]|nr:cupin domain-containing protein [Paracoccaceae bacterium]
MKLLEANKLDGNPLPGRIIYKAAGRGSPIESGAMTVAFGRYSGEYGPMSPHRHAEECVYILESKGGRVRYGSTPDCSEATRELAAGMLLHFPENEWHVFEYDEGGHIDAMFIYGQVDNIRPEEKV